MFDDAYDNSTDHGLPGVVIRDGRPSRREAEAAVRTLIRWAGDDPRREGLIETPAWVVRAHGEWFAGYRSAPAALLARTFGKVGGYGEPVILKDIAFCSCCEHHIAPIRGVAHIAYLPTDRVVGIPKLARLVDGFARRLQIQERMTAEIANTLMSTLAPRARRSSLRQRTSACPRAGGEQPGWGRLTGQTPEQY